MSGPSDLGSVTEVQAALAGVEVLIEDWLAFEEGTVERRNADDLRVLRDSWLAQRDVVAAAREVYRLSAARDYPAFDALGAALAAVRGHS